jgi:hypothetical protein
MNDGGRVRAYHVGMIMPKRSLTLMTLATVAIMAYVHRRLHQRALAVRQWEDEDRLAELIRKLVPAIERGSRLCAD